MKSIQLALVVSITVAFFSQNSLALERCFGGQTISIIDAGEKIAVESLKYRPPGIVSIRIERNYLGEIYKITVNQLINTPVDVGIEPIRLFSELLSGQDSDDVIFVIKQTVKMSEEVKTFSAFSFYESPDLFRAELFLMNTTVSGVFERVNVLNVDQYNLTLSGSDHGLEISADLNDATVGHISSLNIDVGHNRRESRTGEAQNSPEQIAAIKDLLEKVESGISAFDGYHQRLFNAIRKLSRERTGDPEIERRVSKVIAGWLSRGRRTGSYDESLLPYYLKLEVLAIERKLRGKYRFSVGLYARTQYIGQLGANFGSYEERVEVYARLIQRMMLRLRFIELGPYKEVLARNFQYHHQNGSTEQIRDIFGRALHRLIN